MIGLREDSDLSSSPPRAPSTAPAVTGRLFAEAGLLASVLDLEHRPEQANMARAVGEDTRWLGLFLEPFFFVTMIYFVACFGMSQYSLNLEQRLSAGERR